MMVGGIVQRPRQEDINTARKIKRFKDKLCTIPEIIKSQAAYRSAHVITSTLCLRLKPLMHC